MIDSERFVRALAQALPEAFAGLDLAEQFSSNDPAVPDENWWVTIALSRAVVWLSSQALELDVRAQTTTILPGGDDPLRRFFDFIESELRLRGGAPGWMQVELFEGVAWTEAVIEFLGPLTVASLRDAQRTLAWCNTMIGRWRAP